MAIAVKIGDALYKKYAYRTDKGKITNIENGVVTADMGDYIAKFWLTDITETRLIGGLVWMVNDGASGIRVEDFRPGYQNYVTVH